MLPYRGGLVERARRLRREMTKEEKMLWYDFLRYHPVKIYKQKIIDGFIVDFYCTAANLVIEIDGGYHFTPEQMAHDADRTAILSNYNIEVLRFTNAQINEEFDNVKLLINKTINLRRDKKPPI